MDCQQTKQRIPEWMDSALSAEEAAAVGQHLARCSECRTEFKTYAKAWNTLKAWPEAEPDPGYVSRFWTRLSLEKPWYERLLENLRPVVTDKWFAPAFVTVAMVILVGSMTLYNTSTVVKTESVISSLSADDIEFVENIELAENLDVIQNIDLLEDLDVIENLDEFNV
ncbi:MAG: zf-HC2 domain-containing protein [Candidatus Omnitrophica bacterium]|nr:zf-HC2 domain-containing protein [Candidatus Omnitrophota bacterium]